MVFFKWGQNSSVCLVTVLQAGQPRNRGSFSSRGKDFISFRNCSDWLWCIDSLLLKRHRIPLQRD